MKKISSKRPLRSSSGGSPSIRLAVATTKTGAVFSWSQVRNVPKTRAVVPPSLAFDAAEPERPFSISSTQSTAGASALRDADGAAQVLLARADQPAEHPAHVEPEQRERPLGGDGLGGEALAAALDAEEEQPAGLGQAEVRAPRR